MKNTGKSFEEAVYEIVKLFSGDAEVFKNTFITGASGTKRQIDVEVKSYLLGAPVNMIIECKDHKTKIGVKIVDEMVGKVDDVGANIGVIVSNSGFSKNAISRAKRLGHIELYSLINSENKIIRNKLHVPIKVTYSNVDNKLNISFTTKGQHSLSRVEELQFIHGVLKELDTKIFLEFIAKFNSNISKLGSGEHFYEFTIFEKENFNLVMKVGFLVQSKTYINEGIFLPAKAIIDVLNNSIKKSNIGPFSIIENDVLSNWKNIDYDSGHYPKATHYQRCAQFNQKWFEPITKHLIKELENTISRGQ
ncbi:MULTISPECIES: restriction endonuclease [unclassified Methylophaga]|uniref:restriction endonuclease n=1 Tax=unclassified Methylophaga TaxID=2629249 RepID=UPI0025DAC3A6|nr:MULTISPECIES: restriction endonuclease [unclassified Methylophaga]